MAWTWSTSTDSVHAAQVPSLGMENSWQHFITVAKSRIFFHEISLLAYYNTLVVSEKSTNKQDMHMVFLQQSLYASHLYKLAVLCLNFCNLKRHRQLWL